MKRLFFAAAIALISWVKADTGSQAMFDPVVLINEFLRPLVLIVLVLVSSPPKKTVLTFTTAMGLLLSFGGLLFLEVANLNRSPIAWTLFISANLFYGGFLIFSLASLGKNFGLLPAIRSISQGGAFSIVRHPVYSSYIYILISFLIFFPSWGNFAAALSVIIGLLIRVHQEELVLSSEKDFQDLMGQTKRKFFHPVLASPLIVLGTYIWAHSIFSKESGPPAPPKIVRVISASPIYTLDPSQYDEWGAVFIGNHVYPRLLHDDRKQRLFSIGQLIEKKCTKMIEGKCSEEQLKIRINEMKSCANHIINAQTVKKELQIILTKKSWILPKWSFCQNEPNTKDEICLTVSNAQDTERRLKSVYVRHGWLFDKINDKTIGTFPYCFNATQRDNEKIVSGLLAPRASGYPTIDFNVDSGSGGNFDLALYGSDDLLKNETQMLVPHTPAGYYVVSNPHSGRAETFPWNQLSTSSVLASFLKDRQLTISSKNEFDSILPKGEGLSNSVRQTNVSLTFFLPDFIPNCIDLSKQINSLWTLNGFSKSKAVCGDLTKFVYENVMGSKKWDGFLSPITPGGYFRNAIESQYFSSSSNESWIKQTANPSKYFYRIGVAQSFLVASKIFCGLDPNPLGLSDVLITDFKYCSSANPK